MRAPKYGLNNIKTPSTAAFEAIPLVHRKNRTWCCGPRAYLSDEELEQDGVAQRSVVDTYRLDHGRVCQVRQIVLCVVNVRINNCTAHKRVQG